MRTFARSIQHRLRQRYQLGQSIILLALGMIALLAFVGLVTDISLLMVRYSQLRRAVDSASIAAAGQVRENRDYADIALTARQFIRLHGLDPDRILVQTCITNPGDPVLCTNPPRKLVRVVGQIDSPTTFLSLLGWGTITLEASAVAETAQLDVALVIDTSESMSRSTHEDDYTFIGQTPRDGCIGNYESGTCCNDPGTGGEVSDAGVITYPGGPTNNAPDGDYSDLVCQPFKQVRDAARTFVQRLDFVRGDRVVFVTFDVNAVPIAPEDPDNPGTLLPPLLTDEALAIRTLNMELGILNNEIPNAEGEGIWNECLTFGNGTPPYTYDFIAYCTNTNMGGGIQAANAVLTQPEYIRRTAVWVIILLGDGAANRTPRAAGYDEVAGGLVTVNPGEYGYWGYCPWWTFCDEDNPNNEYEAAGCAATGSDPNQTNPHSQPFCADNDSLSRHFCTNASGQPDLNAPDCETDYYDAMDYTMDMADFAGLVEVMDNVPGNFIAMYSIGFGTPEESISPLGEAALRYVADAGDNGLIDNDWFQDCREDHICDNHVPYPDPAFYGPPDDCEGADPLEDCGQYWYAEGPEDLERVFAEIASRLFTRLAR
ncbi:MAG: hypothetical protein JW910_05045 [Anaerolineae bacterium]|nr:hypothetical protein [Anaerolineae bacterium]